MRRLAYIAVAVAVMVVQCFAPALASSKKSKPRPMAVVGTYVNDATICSGAVPGPDGKAPVACRGGSTYLGGWTGKTYIDLDATFDPATAVGDIYRYREWFFGTAEDGTDGVLFIEGWGRLTPTTFEAHSTITGGACGFRGAKGSADFYGNAVAGGFIGTWTRPTSGTSDPACVAERFAEVMAEYPPHPDA